MPASRATIQLWNGLVAGKTTWYGEGYVAVLQYANPVVSLHRVTYAMAIVTHGKASADSIGSWLKGRANPIRKDA